MCLLSQNQMMKYAEKDKMTENKEPWFCAKASWSYQGMALNFGAMGTEVVSTSYPLHFKPQVPQDSRVFTYQADCLVRGFEVGMAALHFSEHPRNGSRL